MSTLVETRTQYVKRLESIKVMQSAQIESQIEAYRKQLEAQLDQTESNKLKDVITALDKVIAFEASSSDTDYAIRDAIASQPAQHVDGRVGMQTIVSPERR